MRKTTRLWNRKVYAKQFNLRWRVLAILPTLLSLLMSVPSAPAQRESDNIALVGRALMGTINAVAVDGNIAYLGTGAGLLVLDVTDPANPRELSRMFLPVVVSDVAVSGQFLFVAGGAELRIFDVSHPAELQEEGIFRASTGSLNRIAVDGSLAYVTGSALLLRVLDVSDPRQPQQVGEFSDLRHSGSPTSIAIVGRVAYVGNVGRFHIVDISDPTQPQGQGLLELPANAYAFDIAVAGDVAYVAAWFMGLRIINVGDPTHPREVGVFQTAGSVYGVAIAGRYGYVAAGRKLQVLDMSDPLTPREVGGLDLRHNNRITLWGSRAYVVASFSILAIVDLTNPANPVQRSDFKSSGNAWSVAVADGIAYVADLIDGLRIVDVSDPASPFERGSVRGFSANDVAVSGSFAYVTFADLETNASGLLILDVSDPDSPIERSRLELPPVALGITLSSSLAYIACGGAGLRIIDVADPDDPQEVGFFDTPGSAFDVTVSGNLAYVADYQGGLRIIDVSDPSRPREVGFDTTTEFSQLAWTDNVLYALGSQGLAIFDLSQPTLPGLLTFLYSYEVFRIPYSVAATQDFFIVGALDSLRIFDARDPTVLVEKAIYPTPASVRGLAVVDGLIYAADAEAGLLILAPIDLRLQANPPITRKSANTIGEDSRYSWMR